MYLVSRHIKPKTSSANGICNFKWPKLPVLQLVTLTLVMTRLDNIMGFSKHFGPDFESRVNIVCSTGVVGRGVPDDGLSHTLNGYGPNHLHIL